MKKKNNKKGFTLAELLIVVAIIAVLTAIAIPVFSAQLEKSRDAVTVSNIRSAYAMAQTAYLTGDSDTANQVTVNKSGNTITSITVGGVVSKGQQDGWGTAADDLVIKGKFDASMDTMGNTPNTYTLTFAYDGNGQISSVSAAGPATTP